MDFQDPGPSTFAETVLATMLYLLGALVSATVLGSMVSAIDQVASITF